MTRADPCSSAHVQKLEIGHSGQQILDRHHRVELYITLQGSGGQLVGQSMILSGGWTIHWQSPSSPEKEKQNTNQLLDQKRPKESPAPIARTER